MWTWETIQENYQRMIERSPQKETIFQAREMLKLIPHFQSDKRFERIEPQLVHASLEFAVEPDHDVVTIWAETEATYTVCIFHPDQTMSGEIIVPLEKVPDTAAAYLEKLRQHALPTTR